MPLWGNTANTKNAPKFMPLAGSNATGNTLFGNTTVGSFKTNESVGIFGVSNANTENSHGVCSPGWQLVTHSTGPVTGMSISGGTGFANGEIVKVMPTETGGANAVGTVTTTALGVPTGITLAKFGDGFANLSSSFTTQFDRNEHVTGVTVGGTPTGYGNTDYILISNGSINASATFVTNVTGGFVTANVTLTNVGLFPNTFVAANLIVGVYASNGAVTNGTGGTFTPVLGTSTGGTLAVTGLGGRAGRVQAECLVAAHLSNSTANFPGA